MKKKLFSLLCALLMLMSLTSMACAAIQASDYFSATGVSAYAKSGGKIKIEVDINATHLMQEVGASVVHIHERQSDGSYDLVYTYTKENTPSLLWKNSSCAYVDVTYQGVVGRDYYALVGCYAKDSEGYEILYFNTNLVTAVRVEP